MQQDLGTPGAPIKPPTPEPQAAEEDEDTLETTAEEEESEYELGTDLEIYSTLTEKAIYFNHLEDKEMAEMLFNLKAEIE